MDPTPTPRPTPTHPKKHYHTATGGSGTVAFADVTGTVATAQIADNAVTNAKMADNAIDTAEIVDSAVTSAKILNGTIATGDMAAAAITQNGLAVGATSSPTTTSVTFVDLTDMAVTLTTVGGDLLCWFTGSFSNSGAGFSVFTALSLDAATEVNEIAGTEAIADYVFNLTNVYRFTGVSAANHTVKARWRVDAGTGTASTTRRSLLVLETKR